MSPEARARPRVARSFLLSLEPGIVARDAPSFPEIHFDRPVSLGGGLSEFQLLRFNDFFFLFTLAGIYRIEGACPVPLEERGVRIGNNSVAASIAGVRADLDKRRHHQIPAYECESGSVMKLHSSGTNCGPAVNPRLALRRILEIDPIVL